MGHPIEAHSDHPRIRSERGIRYRGRPLPTAVPATHPDELSQSHLQSVAPGFLCGQSVAEFAYGEFTVAMWERLYQLQIARADDLRRVLGQAQRSGCCGRLIRCCPRCPAAARSC
ncbi:hypothetical protein AR457_37620 [Streptomyces agglomeratus]|nr:hypothetical protein AR457_37620 [Streptomyces agglomeratus]